jgi:antitoxin HicB
VHRDTTCPGEVKWQYHRRFDDKLVRNAQRASITTWRARGEETTLPGMNTVGDRVRYYLGLPYRISVTRDDEDEAHPWRAAVEELAGCEARGASAAEAVARIPNALAEWVTGAHAAGREIPEPHGTRAYSGKLLLRMPQSMHAALAQAAESDNVSLNAYINGLLAASVGWRVAPGAEPEPLAASERVAAASAARRQRLLTIALIVNVALVGIAAIVALVLLLYSV